MPKVRRQRGPALPPARAAAAQAAWVWVCVCVFLNREFLEGVRRGKNRNGSETWFAQPGILTFLCPSSP